MKVRLSRIASARSGDKGEGSNVGVIARSEPAYRFLKEHLTADVVRAHSHVAAARVERRTLRGKQERPLRIVLELRVGGDVAEQQADYVRVVGELQRAIRPLRGDAVVNTAEDGRESRLAAVAAADPRRSRSS